MERTRLELLFDQELLQNAEQARILCGSPVTRFVRSVQTTGGVSAVRELCRRNRPSDAFDSLAQAGRLDLSAEASAVKGKYGPLFTDDEVNACLALLLEAGYFQKRDGKHRPAWISGQQPFMAGPENKVDFHRPIVVYWTQQAWEGTPCIRKNNLKATGRNSTARFRKSRLQARAVSAPQARRRHAGGGAAAAL